MSELTETRDLLAGVTFESAPDKPAEDKPAEAQPAPDESEEAARRSRVSANVQVERVLQNTERSRHETLGVAVAFDDIREEMINNRVDTEELKKRLSEGVAEPLKQIVANRFPRLEEQLKLLATQVSDPKAAPATKTAAVAQVDLILVEMKQVLDKMLELETFNEVLDTLRKIIDEQGEVNDETKREQKQNLRDLIE
jgi:hypothetical protein